MINIKEPKDCCGCNACAQRCPKHCINLQEDNEGFLYPKIDINLCIECGLCEKVCPVINQSIKKEPLQVFAAINPDEKVRMESSSGGIFTLLAEKVIQENGVVFGARFDENWEVKHDYTETMEGLATFRGSKYVQSRIEDNYLKAEKFLKEGRKVLFSGTPCQIAGLKKFLKKRYDNLLTVDFICHGVPSPKVWRIYLDETCKNLIKSNKRGLIFSTLTHNEKRSYCIKSINFRNKVSGWKKYSFHIKVYSSDITKLENIIDFYEPFSDNIFMKGFLNDIYLRPSCYQCPCKSGKSNSDITIADFWGIENLLTDMDDNKGTSLVFINTEEGIYTYKQLKQYCKKISYSDIIPYNKGLKSQLTIPTKRSVFFTHLQTTDSICKLIVKMTKDPIIKTIKRAIKKIIHL